MAIKRSKAPPGTLVTLEHSSRVLRDNPWGDPHVRRVAVWLPPQYDQAAGDRTLCYRVFTDGGKTHRVRPVVRARHDPQGLARR